MARLVTKSLAVIALAAALVLLGAYLIARASISPLDGRITLKGLHAPVEVVFDVHAIPHVYARGEDDLWLIAGVLHARERLWQMEMYRRAAAGRLSELLGEAALSLDQQVLSLGLRKAAALEWERTSSRSRQRLERYVAGVNSVIAGLRWVDRPPEFQLLSLQPKPWTGVDALSVAALFSWRLAGDMWSELVRAELTARFGVGEAAWLMGTSAWFEQVPASVLAETKLQLAPHAAALPALFDRASTPPAVSWLAVSRRDVSGLAFALAPARTTTARPILAADLHTALELPAPWYELHLVASGINVIGATIPGLPYVLHGHNERIAWALINSGEDVQDLVLEQVDLSRRRYRFDQAWASLDAERNEIPIRGRAHPAQFTRFTTRHGPLVRTPGGHAAAVRWPTLQTGDSSEGLFRINRAASWNEFLAGAELLGLPPQRALYAETQGNIAEVLTGVLPTRGPEAGSVPLPGWTGRHESTGVTRGETLLKTFGPASGQILADTSWPPTRSEKSDARQPGIQVRGSRLGALLAQARVDMKSAQRILNDVGSAPAELVLEWVERAAAWARKHKGSTQTITLLERLRLWDRHVDDRPVVSLFELFELKLWRRIFSDEMDQAPFERFHLIAAAQPNAGLYALLARPASRLVDDIGTIDHQESLEEIVALTAADALKALRARYGAEADWSWGRLHAASFVHPLTGRSTVHRWWFRRDPLPMLGDANTVRAAGFDLREPFSTSRAPTFRMILDVGDWDRSLAINATGQSGHLLSAHAFDQAQLWNQGRYRSLLFTRRAIEAAKASSLLLVP